MTCPLIRVDTNQGLVGWGEVRDGSSETYALFLKSRILGENPYNVDKIFRKIKQFGGHARQAGGVCCIQLARAMEKWNLAWMEDMVPWEYTELLKQITESTTTPILTGEDI